MSKYEDPTQLDYRYGGDTVDDFAQKYMKTVAYIFSALNELRSPTGGTLTQSPEAYQLKVDDNKLYIRNQANTDWILLGDVQENFGFRTSASDAFMHESDVADSGTAGKLIRADASGKLNADILGNAAKIADKAIQMGLDLADEDRLVYDKDTDTITNRPLQFKVDGDKIYARKDATTGWVLLGDLKQNLGFRSSTDDAFLTESDVADNGTAGKLIRADVNGKLNVDILGNARKMAGRTFAPEDLQDGQIPVYRTSDGTWHAENKGTVGAGKNLMIMDGDKMLGEYNGDEMKAIDIQKSSLTKALAESTGYGIVSGCEPTINNLTVTTGAGVVHLSDGTRKEMSATNITLNNADGTNPRIDLVYIDSTGAVAKVTGTASATPVVPALPTGGISVCNVTIAAGASTGTVNRVRTIAPNLANYGVVNVKDFGAVGDGAHDDTAAIQAAIDYASTNAETVYIPCGKYKITSTIYVKTNIIGGGYQRDFRHIAKVGTTIFDATGGNSKLLDMSNSNYGCSLRGFSIYMQTNSTAIYYESVNGRIDENLLSRIAIFNLQGVGIDIRNSESRGIMLDDIVIWGQGANYESLGIDISQTYDVRITNTEVMACRVGIKSGYNTYISDSHLWGNSIYNPTGAWWLNTIGIITPAQSGVFLYLNNVYLDSWHLAVQALGNANVIANNIFATSPDTADIDISAGDPNAPALFRCTRLLLNNIHMQVFAKGPRLIYGNEDWGLVDYQIKNIKLHVLCNADTYIKAFPFYAGGSRYYDVEYPVYNVSSNSVGLLKIGYIYAAGGCIEIKVYRQFLGLDIIRLSLGAKNYIAGKQVTHIGSDATYYLSLEKNGIRTLYMKKPQANAKEWATVICKKDGFAQKTNLLDCHFDTSNGTDYADFETTLTDLSGLVSLE